MRCNCKKSRITEVKVSSKSKGEMFSYFNNTQNISKVGEHRATNYMECVSA